MSSSCEHHTDLHIPRDTSSYSVVTRSIARYTAVIFANINSFLCPDLPGYNSSSPNSHSFTCTRATSLPISLQIILQNLQSTLPTCVSASSSRQSSLCLQLQALQVCCTTTPAAFSLGSTQVTRSPRTDETTDNTALNTTAQGDELELAAADAGCYTSGRRPFCAGHCPSPYVECSTFRGGCLTGHRSKCCNPSTECWA